MTEEWITDSNGNTASVAYFGSHEKARAALASLKNCIGTSDCVECVGCYFCEMCNGCSNCLHSVMLVQCVNCCWCLRCDNCENLVGSRYCDQCADSVDCIDCTACKGCAGCTACTHCRNADDFKNQYNVTKEMHVLLKIHGDDILSAIPSQASLEILDTDTLSFAPAEAVIARAGPEGAELAARFGPLLAALLIARENGSTVHPIQFVQRVDQ